MFASKSLALHLLRGALGVGSWVLAAHVANEHALFALPLLALGILALRGCPTCWTIGLIETVWARLRGRPSEGCTDGRCSTSATRP